MADFAQVGYQNFEPLVQAQNTSVNESNYASNQLAQLGQQIATNISTNNMRNEAQQIAPLLSQHYQQGLAAIGSGDYGGGLSQIYGANMIAAQNPLLKPVAQQAAVSADMALRGTIRTQQMAQRDATMQDINQNTQINENQRNQFTQDQLNQRQQNSLTQQQQPKPLTTDQKVRVIGQYGNIADKTLDAMQSAKTPDDFASAYTQYKTIVPVLQSAGIDVNNPHVDDEAHKKLDEINTQLDGYAQQLAQNPNATTGWLGFGDKIKDLASQAQDVKDRIIAASTKAIKAGYTPEQGAAQVPQVPSAQSQAANLPQPPAAAISFLKSNPGTAATFDKHFGQGASQQYLSQ